MKNTNKSLTEKQRIRNNINFFKALIRLFKKKQKEYPEKFQIYETEIKMLNYIVDDFKNKYLNQTIND